MTQIQEKGLKCMRKIDFKTLTERLKSLNIKENEESVTLAGSRQEDELGTPSETDCLSASLVKYANNYLPRRTTRITGAPTIFGGFVSNITVKSMDKSLFKETP